MLQYANIDLYPLSSHLTQESCVIAALESLVVMSKINGYDCGIFISLPEFFEVIANP